MRPWARRPARRRRAQPPEAPARRSDRRPGRCHVSQRRRRGRSGPAGRPHSGARSRSHQPGASANVGRPRGCNRWHCPRPGRRRRCRGATSPHTNHPPDGVQAEQIDDAVHGVFHVVSVVADTPRRAHCGDGSPLRPEAERWCVPPGTRTQNLRIKRPLPAVSVSVGTCAELRFCTGVRPSRCTGSGALDLDCLLDKHLTAVPNTGTG
jgi:hypothetical protein